MSSPNSAVTQFITPDSGIYTNFTLAITDKHASTTTTRVKVQINCLDETPLTTAFKATEVNSCQKPKIKVEVAKPEIDPYPRPSIIPQTVITVTGTDKHGKPLDGVDVEVKTCTAPG